MGLDFHICCNVYIHRLKLFINIRSDMSDTNQGINKYLRHNPKHLFLFVWQNTDEFSGRQKNFYFVKTFWFLENSFQDKLHWLTYKVWFYFDCKWNRRNIILIIHLNFKMQKLIYNISNQLIWDNDQVVSLLSFY